MDVPRGKRPTSADRLTNIARTGAGLGMLGATRMAKPARPPAKTGTRPTSRTGDGVPLGTGGGTTEFLNFFGDGSQIYVAPDGDALLFGVKLPGDEFPQILFSCSAGGGIYFGDGTQIVNDMVNMYLFEPGVLGVAPGLQADTLILNSPNGTAWEIQVDNSGNISAALH